MKALNIIEGSQILETKDFDLLKDMKEELKDTFLYAQVFRTRTEMETSILSDMKFGTPDAKYWQSVREQNVMFTELVNLSYEYRKNEVEIKMLKRDILKEDDELEQELLKIEVERKEFVKLQQERVAKDRIREINEWHEIKKRLEPELTCGTENVDKHQLLSYTIRWINQANALTGNEGIAEKTNLIAQLDMGIKHCKNFGFMPLLESAFGKEELAKITG